MRRTALILVPLAVIMIGSVFVGSPIVALILLLAAFALIWGLSSRDRPTRDPGWAAPSQTVPEATTAHHPTPPSRSWKIVRTLGRVEGRFLFFSPAFAAGLGFCVLIFVLFVFTFGGGLSEPWSETLQAYPWYVHPLAGLTVIASHRAVTRAARDGTAEVFDTCPTPASTQTLGHLAAAWMPIAVAAAFLVVMTIGTRMMTDLVHGPVSTDDLLDVFSAVLLLGGAVALGVALGRWFRATIVPVVVVFGIALATLAINGIGGKGWNPYTALSTAPTIEGPSPVFTDRPAVFHLIWIVGLVLLVATIALLHDRRDRAVRISGAVAIVLLVVAAIGATRPLSTESADHIADLVARPRAHQTCASASERVEVCTFDHHAGLLTEFTRSLEPVAEALPAVAGSFVLRQRYTDDLDGLPPEVRSRLAGIDLEVPPGEVVLSDIEDIEFDADGPARALALAAVGLPEAPDEELMPAVAAGQARGVVALWLATIGDAASRADDLRSEDPGSADAFERGTLGGVGDCSTPSVVWSAQDLQAAREVVGLADRDVRAVLEADWATWVDPATSTDDLLEALGLDPVGPFDRVRARPGNPC